MKASKIMLAATLAIFGLTGCIADKNVIMKVNDQAITKAQYEQTYKEEVDSAQTEQFQEYLKDKNSVMSLMVRDRIVNELILKTLMEQEFAKREITVTKEEIEAKKAEITEQVGSKEKLNELLRSNAISNKKFEEDIEKEVKVEKLIASTGNANVSDKEVRNFYNQNKAQFNFPERVRASHILIEVNPAAIKQEIISQDKKGVLTSDEINKKVQEAVDNKMNFAREVRAKVVKNPEQFAALAKQYSDDKGSAQKGGDLGFFSREMMVKPFSDAAFKLKPGTVSEVVVSDYGNHIIMVTDKAAAGVQPYAKMKDEIAAYLAQKKKIDVLKNLLEGLKASAKIEYVDSDYDLNNIKEMIKKQNEAQKELTKKEQKASK